MTEDNHTIDSLLNKLNGFGPFQIFIIFLMLLLGMLVGITFLDFVFVAAIQDYRCRVPVCDFETVVDYKPDFISYTVPFKNGAPKYCSRFALVNYTAEVNTTTICPPELFSKEIEECMEEDLVFPDRHTSLLNDLKIFCEHNLWKLSMIGTFGSLGIIFGGPVGGFLSDRYGRKKLIVIASVLTAIFGTGKSFSTSITQYMILNVLQSCFAYTLFGTAFILGIELVGPSYRLYVTTVFYMSLSAGEILLGVAAWYFDSWRTFLRVLYSPALLFIAYWWVVPESIKWLVCKNNFHDIDKTLNRISKINNRPLPEDYKMCLKIEGNTEKTDISLIKALSHRTVCLRFINTCFIYLCNHVLYFGLSLDATSLFGNKYINFIIVSAIEMPANILGAVCLKYFSRRLIICLTYLMTGILCISQYFINGNYLSVIIYTLGKFMITIASNTLLIVTTELFPTGIRNSVFNICYGCGGIGAMMAPQIPLLAMVWTPAPMIAYGIFGFIASALTTMFPKTYNDDLPDTIEETENMSQIPSSTKV